MSLHNDRATWARTYATFRLFSNGDGDELDPAEVTRVLGVKASDSFRRGWFLTSKAAVESRDLRRHVDWLLEALEPNSGYLVELIDAGAAADIFCYWESRSGHGGPELSPSQMARLAQLRLPFRLDIYFTGETCLS